MFSMPAGHIDFWFTMGSTYSYLSVMRLVQLERLTGIRFRWRPFHLLVILQEMKHVPFADKPSKSAYMWRDVERRAAMTYRYRFLRNNRLWRTLSRSLVCVRAGASLLSALPIVVGSSLGRRPGASLIYPKASATSEWSRSEHSH